MPQSLLAVPTPVAGVGGQCQDETRGMFACACWLIAMLLLPAWCRAAEIAGHIDLSTEGKPLRAEETQDAIIISGRKSRPRCTRITNPVMARGASSSCAGAGELRSQSVRFPNEVRSCTTPFPRRRTMPLTSACTARVTGKPSPFLMLDMCAFIAMCTIP